MTLILDHINGENHDDRLENLRWVCPNCNQQLPTTGGRNQKRRKNIIIVLIVVKKFREDVLDVNIVMVNLK